MKKIVKFLLLALFVIAIIIPLMYLSNGTETAFIINEFDFPLEWSHGDVRVAEITSEELKQYPILKNLSNSDCTKYSESWWRCKVSHEEWNRTKNFIDKKENAETCIKIGEKCYRIDFVTCCTKDVEITDISLGRCACPPNNTEMYRQQQGNGRDGRYGRNEQNNEIGLLLIVTIQNNQSIGTSMLTSKIEIKNSANIIVANYSSDVPFYIKSNSSINNQVTIFVPGPGEYEIDFQVLEKDKIIAQRYILI